MGLVASACDIDENELLYHDSPEYSKCSDLDRLTELLKKQTKNEFNSGKSKDLNFSTSRSISITCNEFDISKYLLKKAGKLKISKGILAEPKRRKEMY